MPVIFSRICTVQIDCFVFLVVYCYNSKHLSDKAETLTAHWFFLLDNKNVILMKFKENAGFSLSGSHIYSRPQTKRKKHKIKLNFEGGGHLQDKNYSIWKTEHRKHYVCMKIVLFLPINIPTVWQASFLAA